MEEQHWQVDKRMSPSVVCPRMSVLILFSFQYSINLITYGFPFLVYELRIFLNK